MALFPGVFSPDVKNLIIPKGFATIKRDDEAVYHHMGNAPSVVFTPSADVLEHFTSMQGIKLKDETITLTQGGTIKVTMEEMTARNLALMTMGDVDDTDLSAVTIDIFSRASIVTAMKWFATNSKGPRWYWDFTQVTFTPGGDVGLVADAYGNMIASGSVESVNGDFGTITLKGPVGNYAPENVLAPLLIANDPPQIGDEVGIESGWVGASSFAYNWVGGTGTPTNEALYTIAGGDTTFHVTVTATNAVGSTPANSNAITVGTTF